MKNGSSSGMRCTFVFIFSMILYTKTYNKNAGAPATDMDNYIIIQRPMFSVQFGNISIQLSIDFQYVCIII